MSASPVWAILAGAVLTMLTAWALGRILLRSCSLKLCRFEEDLIAMLTGAAILSFLLFLLASVHLARKNAFLAICLLAISVAWRRGAIGPAKERLPKLPGFWLILFAAPFAAYSALYFFNALAPEASPNGSTIYLGSVAVWWREHGFAAIEYPRGLGMLFLFAFSMGKHSAASLVHFSFLAAAPCLLVCYGRRFGLARGFVLGAILFYASPISGIDGASAYYDVAAACVLFGCFYTFQLWATTKERRWLIPAVLLASFGCVLVSGALPAGFRLPVRNLPALWSLNGQHGAGLFGPWMMLAPLALLALRSAHGRRLLVAAAICLPLLLLDNTTRFLLPAAVFLAPALGIAVQNSPGIAPLLIVLHSLFSWPSAVAAFAAEDSWRITDLPVTAALRRIPQHEYLKKRVPGYAVARFIEEGVPASARVLGFEAIPQAYTSRRLSLGTSDPGQRAVQSITTAFQSVVIPPLELRFQFRETPVRSLRVVRTGTASAGWTVTEMRVFRAGTEIARKPEWQVTGVPDTFDTPRAFDNSEVTAWPVWGAASPGMYLEEDFRNLLPLDSVILVCHRDAQHASFRLEGLGSDGQWKTLADRFDLSLHQSPTGLRRAASDELKSLGFGYIVSTSNTDLGGDLHRNPTFWGVTCVREMEGVCVYRLD